MASPNVTANPRRPNRPIAHGDLPPPGRSPEMVHLMRYLKRFYVTIAVVLFCVLAIAVQIRLGAIIGTPSEFTGEELVDEISLIFYILLGFPVLGLAILALVLFNTLARPHNKSQGILQFTALPFLLLTCGFSTITFLGQPFYGELNVVSLFTFGMWTTLALVLTCCAQTLPRHRVPATLAGVAPMVGGIIAAFSFDPDTFYVSSAGMFWAPALIALGSSIVILSLMILVLRQEFILRHGPDHSTTALLPRGGSVPALGKIIRMHGGRHMVMAIASLYGVFALAIFMMMLREENLLEDRMQFAFVLSAALPILLLFAGTVLAALQAPRLRTRIFAPILGIVPALPVAFFVIQFTGSPYFFWVEFVPALFYGMGSLCVMPVGLLIFGLLALTERRMRAARPHPMIQYGSEPEVGEEEAPKVRVFTSSAYIQKQQGDLFLDP